LGGVFSVSNPAAAARLRLLCKHQHSGLKSAGRDACAALGIRQSLWNDPGRFAETDSLAFAKEDLPERSNPATSSHWSAFLREGSGPFTRPEVSWSLKPENTSTLLVALTGCGQADDRKNAFEAGFDAHIVKPFNGETFTGLLAERLPAVPSSSERAD
jgi:hypothetical protein